MLLRAKEAAEEGGYSFIHGLTDSLWVKKEGAKREDYEETLERAVQPVIEVCMERLMDGRMEPQELSIVAQGSWSLLCDQFTQRGA